MIPIGAAVVAFTLLGGLGKMFTEVKSWCRDQGRPRAPWER